MASSAMPSDGSASQISQPSRSLGFSKDGTTVRGPRARLVQSWGLEPADVTTHPPRNWGQAALERLASLSEMCTSHEGIAAIENARHQRVTTRPKPNNCVAPQDIEAAIIAVSSDGKELEEKSQSEGEQQREIDANVSRNSKGRTMGRIESRSRPLASSPPSAVGSLELDVRLYSSPEYDFCPPSRTTSRGKEVSRMPPGEDASIVRHTVTDASSAPEEPASPQRSLGTPNGQFPLPPADQMLDRCAAFVDADKDDLLYSQIVQLRDHSRLGWWQQQRLQVPHLLDYMRPPHISALMHAESCFYTQKGISPIRSDRARLPRVADMLHSLSQQAIREDPVNYAVTVALQHDHEWRLCSMPRPARLGRILGDTILDDGSFATTTFFPAVRHRPIISHYFSWKTQWIDLPNRHRVFLQVESQLVSVEDIKSEMGELAFAHMNAACTVPPSYRGTSSRNPASMSFPHCSAIGAALAGAESWDSPQIRYELETLLGPDGQKAADFVSRTRRRILQAWRVCYEELRQTRDERMRMD